MFWDSCRVEDIGSRAPRGLGRYKSGVITGCLRAGLYKCGALRDFRVAALKGYMGSHQLRPFGNCVGRPRDFLSALGQQTAQ